MPHISLEVPDDLLLTLREQPGEFAQELRVISAIHYLREKRLSLGQAALLAGMNRLDFLDLLSARGVVAFDLSAEDAAAEVAAARRRIAPDDHQ
jgi:predicted HTH domain antitoxin